MHGEQGRHDLEAPVKPLYELEGQGLVRNAFSDIAERVGEALDS